MLRYGNQCLTHDQNMCFGNIFQGRFCPQLLRLQMIGMATLVLVLLSIVHLEASPVSSLFFNCVKLRPAFFLPVIR